MRRLLTGTIGLFWAILPATGGAQGLAIKAGASFSNVSNSGVLPGNAKQRTGYAVGLGLESSGELGWGLEGLYAQRGVTSSTPGDSRELNYIDVPLYLRLTLPVPGLRPFAYAGPQLSFEQKCTNGAGTCPDSGRAKTTDAAVIGAGGHFGGLALEGRYIYGLTDLKLSTVKSSSSYQSRSLLLLVGIGM